MTTSVARSIEFAKHGGESLKGDFYAPRAGGSWPVFPREVEDVLAAQPGVAAAAVIGVPDERWGEAVKAFVVRKAGADIGAAALIAAVRDAKGSVQAPKSIEFLEQLPLTAVGKIDKVTLRAPYWKGRARKVG
jgi:fatty-acyl-CoA synthase